MYTVTIKSKDTQMSIGNGYVMPEHQISNLIGKLLTLVETLGLQEKQEKSFKEIVKQAVWGNVRDMKPIDSSLLTLINNFAHELSREERYRGSNIHNVQIPTPPECIIGDYELSFKEADISEKIK